MRKYCGRVCCSHEFAKAPRHVGNGKGVCKGSSVGRSRWGQKWRSPRDHLFWMIVEVLFAFSGVSCARWPCGGSMAMWRMCLRHFGGAAYSSPGDLPDEDSQTLKAGGQWGEQWELLSAGLGCTHLLRSSHQICPARSWVNCSTSLGGSRRLYAAVENGASQKTWQSVD